MAKILVIEDEPALRTMMRTMLSGFGHHVSEAGDGRRGIRAVAANEPELVICDIVMPDQDGIETIMQLHKTHPGLPILAISGGSPLYLRMARQFGAAAGLEKPFTARELRTSVDQLLNA